MNTKVHKVFNNQTDAMFCVSVEIWVEYLYLDTTAVKYNVLTAAILLVCFSSNFAHT